MNINITLPRWLAKILFPKTFAELDRRSAITGSASKGGELEAGPISVEWVSSLDKKD
jgi:hypothetical protein